VEIIAGARPTGGWQNEQIVSSFIEDKSFKASVIYSNNEPKLTSCDNLTAFLQ
jgi:hypothetical protein